MAVITDVAISKLYLATFGRPLDANGLAYWTNSGIYSDGSGGTIFSMEELSENFALQTEYLQSYPSDTTDTLFINSIYQNLFQRDVDAAGLAYWLDGLSSGTVTRDKAILTIINGAQDTQDGNDLSLLTNRTQAALTLATEYSITDTLAKSSGVISALFAITDNQESITTQINEMVGLLDTSSLSRVNNALGSLSNSSTDGVLSLYSDAAWTKKEITFSFNQSIPQSYYEYNNGELVQGWNALNNEQEEAVRSVVSEINTLLGITLKEVSTDGDIKFNLLDMAANTAGFSFTPDSHNDYAGDIFLSNDFNNKPDVFGLAPGEWGYSTIVHEMGHSFGLKHPFEGANTLSSELDNLNYSIMSYTNINSYVPQLSFSANKISMDYTSLNPLSYSLYDVAALQSIYGVNNTASTEDNTYSLGYKENKLFTIWDAGGNDTINVSTTTGKTTIDLSSGTLNSIDEQSLAEVISLYQDIATEAGKSFHNNWIAENITNLYTSNNLYTAKNNLAIATGVIIENVMTGLGDDTVKDNEVNNTISTNSGNDTIYVGKGGIDYIDGGDGSDILYVDIEYSNLKNIALDNQTYVLFADSFEVHLTNVEKIIFLNGVEHTPDTLL